MIWSKEAEEEGEEVKTRTLEKSYIHVMNENNQRRIDQFKKFDFFSFVNLNVGLPLPSITLVK